MYRKRLVRVRAENRSKPFFSARFADQRTMRGHFPERFVRCGKEFPAGGRRLMMTSTETYLGGRWTPGNPTKGRGGYSYYVTTIAVPKYKMVLWFLFKVFR